MPLTDGHLSTSRTRIGLGLHTKLKVAHGLKWPEGTIGLLWSDYRRLLRLHKVSKEYGEETLIDDLVDQTVLVIRRDAGHAV